MIALPALIVTTVFVVAWVLLCVVAAVLGVVFGERKIKRVRSKHR